VLLLTVLLGLATTYAHAVNSISVVNPTCNQIYPTGTYSVKVNYSADQTSTIVVFLLSAAPNYAYQGEGRVTVPAGSGTAIVNVTVSGTAALGTGYGFYAKLRNMSGTEVASGSGGSVSVGFKSSNAHDRWWEARQIWGLLVNLSRAWARQVGTMIVAGGADRAGEAVAAPPGVPPPGVRARPAGDAPPEVHLQRDRPEEVYQETNEYSNTVAFLSRHEYQTFSHKHNPPNYLLQLQGEDLRRAFNQGWLSDYRFVRLEETLVEFNHVQGKSERIKNTPFPRQYSFFPRVFVFIHASLLPFVFVGELGWMSIPVSVIISFVFLCLDLVGERTEDPFENRLEDVPLTALSLTIETNLKEQWGEQNFPRPKDNAQGVVL
jgi:putative membrane protein